MSSFGVYELTIRRLLDLVGRRLNDPDLEGQLREQHIQILESKNSMLAQRYTEDTISRLCEQHGLTFVMLFDEFDDMLERLNRRFFLNLRSLRDQHKYQLCFVVATRRAPVRIREDVAKSIEPFYELLTLNVFGLRPYTVRDGQTMIQRLARRHDVLVESVEASRILELTGGHAGLITAVFELGRRAGVPLVDSEGIEQCVREPSTMEECRKIWLSVDSDEQIVLAAIATGSQVPSEYIQLVVHLETKGIVFRNGLSSLPRLFCPLFSRYIEIAMNTIVANDN